MRQILNPKNNIDGILLLNKPLNLTSNAALQRVKKHFGAAKAGHTGSLDPLATGMLPICLGEATKFSQYVLDSDKTYRATGLLGVKTSTGDAAGEVIALTPNVNVSEAELIAVLQDFQGETLQTPSMFSALKHQGVPLYRYARQGIDIEREARPIHIHDLQLLEFDGISFVIQVTCSKGTYIRNLVEDIGDKLGTGAHVSQLHRLHIAGYSEQKMYQLEDILTMELEQFLQCLLPMETPVNHYSSVVLSLSEVNDLQQGKVLDKQGGIEGECVRLYDENALFVGLALWGADSTLRAKRLLRTEDRR